jgi:hemerythrin
VIDYDPLGIDEIDRDHREILSLFEETTKLVNNRSEDRSIIRYMDLILKMLRAHANLEESIMRENGILDPKHVLEHSRYILDLDAQKNQLEFELKRFQVLWNDTLQTMLLKDFTILDGKLAAELTKPKSS